MHDLEGTRALEVFKQNLLGSDARLRKKKKDKACPTELYGGFRSLFQGGHLGVEFALQAHQGLLSSGDVLRDCCRLQGNAPLPLGGKWEALIDDYFAIGTEPVGGGRLNCSAARALADARAIYESEGVIGSVEKDVEACWC